MKRLWGFTEWDWDSIAILAVLLFIGVPFIWHWFEVVFTFWF